MQETILFKLKGNQYNLKFPNVGGYKQIQVNKQLLTNNTYQSMIQTYNKESQLACDVVDIEATLTVIAPEQFFKDLGTKSISELGMLDFNELRKEYIGQILPWWREIEQALSLQNEEPKA